MEKTTYVFGLARDPEEKPQAEALAYIKKEYGMTQEHLKKLKSGTLFRLSDFFEYYIYDTEEVLFDEEAETYYSTGNSFATSVEKESVIALCDENGEINFF